MQRKPPLFANPAECHAWFRAQGINIAQWCREHNLSRQIVTDLLRGTRKGYRGEAHRAAIALGLKPSPEQLSPQPEPKKMTRRTNIIDRIAELAGQDTANQIAQELGGRLVYIRVDPSASMREQDARIFAEFTGDNHAALADKFNVMVSTVYRAIHRQHARQQQALSEANLRAWENAGPALWACRVTQLNLLTFLQAALQAAETAKAQGCLDRLAIALAILPTAPPVMPSADTPEGSPDAPAGSQSCTQDHAGNPPLDPVHAPSA